MQNDRLEAFRLVNQAIDMQWSDGGPLKDVETCILCALELDPNSIEAMQEAAHYYYSVDEQIEKAKSYASRCKDATLKVVEEMDRILLMTPNSRQRPMPYCL